MGVTALDAAGVRTWADLSAELLDAARADLDAANVFPVPDHDTGTNLAATARAATAALHRAGDVADLAGALHHLAAGAVRGARGNSGVLLSQVLRGLADAAGSAPEGPARAWAAGDLPAALHRAAGAARAAVADPVDGTLLDVADAAAAAASAALPATDHAPAGEPPVRDLLEVLDPVVRGARTALAATTDRLGALAAGGVVDAGAAGLLLVLEALRRAVGGPPVDVLGAGTTVPGRPAPGHDPAVPEPAPPRAPAFEVQYLLQLPPGADEASTVDTVVTALRPLGDSLVVADDGGGVWAVHVHVDDPGVAVDVGAAAAAWGGRLSGVRITVLPTSGTGAPPPGDRPAGTGRPAVVVADADVLPATRAAFADTDVVVLASGGTPPGDDVVVVAVGEAAAATVRAATAAAVVPVRSLVQAMAAVAVHDPGRRDVDDTVAMAEAAGACRSGHLSVATGEGLTIVGRCRPGDVLGHVGDEIAVIGPTDHDVAAQVLDRLLAGGGELVTVLHTPEATDLARALAGQVRAAGEHLDVDVRAVGPMASPVLLGVE